MINSIEISAIIILSIIIGVLIWLNIVNKEWVKKSQSGSRYGSFNVPSGKSLTLTCPSGYTMKLDKLFVGSGPFPGANSSQIEACYSSLQDSIECKIPTPVYSSKSSTNLSTTLSDACDGKSTCTISTDDVNDIIDSASRGDCNSEDCTSYIFGIIEYN